MSARRLDLPQGHAWRFDACVDRPVTVTLREGSVECFGRELARDEPHTFHSGSFELFTWYGCLIEVAGLPDGAPARPAPASSMVEWVNLHTELEKLREAAEAGRAEPPRVLLAGPTDTGKSTLSSTLIGFAVRLGRTPVLVDLDVGQNGVGPTGTVAAAVVDRHTVSVTQGYQDLSPLMYFAGSASPAANRAAYLGAIDSLAARVHARCAADPGVRASGFVVNTCGWVVGDGYAMIVHAARALRVNMVLVTGGDEALAAALRRDLGGRGGAAAAAAAAGAAAGVAVKRLSPAVGTSTRPKDARRAARDASIHSYFYGLPGGPALEPARQTVAFAALQVLRWRADAPTAAVEAAPIIRDQLRGRLAAIVHARDAAEVATANVAGFVIIEEVDPSARTVTLLCPAAGPLPSAFLIVGDIVWTPER